MRQIIVWEEGLKVVEECIEKAKMVLEGYQPSLLFKPEDYIKYYDCIFYMSVQPDPYCYSLQLCEMYKRALAEGITSRVLPSLWGKTDSSLLLELANMWVRYKKMASCLRGIFQYLERYTTQDSLLHMSVCCFHDLVFVEHYQEFQTAAISLIRKDRDEETLNRELLQSTITLFVDIGLGNKCYYNNFQNAVLADAASYYSQLASQWLVCYSFTVYGQKTALCLTKERARASQFLDQDSVEKLLQVVQSHMVNQVANKLLEKKKAESIKGSDSIQELLSQCASLNLEDGNSSV